MRISDWSSDVCSSDLNKLPAGWADACEVAHFGCISMVREQLGSRLVALAERLKQRGVRISFDPNHRHLMDARYTELFERMARVADLRKAWERDVAAIYPGRQIQQAVERVGGIGVTGNRLDTRDQDGGK